MHEKTIGIAFPCSTAVLWYTYCRFSKGGASPWQKGSCRSRRKTSPNAASNSWTSSMSAAMHMSTTRVSAPPSSAACSKRTASRSVSLPSRTGANRRASKRSASPASGSSSPPATWTRWSTTTPSRNTAAPWTPTAPAARRANARTTRSRCTATSSGRRIRMPPSSSAASKRPCAASATTTTGPMR